MKRADINYNYCNRNLLLKMKHKSKHKILLQVQDAIKRIIQITEPHNKLKQAYKS